jgi:cytochrome c biogenesis protein
VRFDGAEEFVNLQVSHDPSQTWVLIAAIVAMAGLLVSLVIKRRRVWARVYQVETPGSSPAGVAGNDAPSESNASEVTLRRTVIELGGLARTDSAGWGEEFTELCASMPGAVADAPTQPPAGGKA